MVSILDATRPSGAAVVLPLSEEQEQNLYAQLEAPDGVYAFATALALANKQPFCSATLIAPRWAITMAYCVADVAKEPSTLNVLVGSTDLEEAEAVKVTRVIQQEPGDDGSDNRLSRLALLELERAVSPRPIKIAHRSYRPKSTDPGETGDSIVIGWGQIAESRVPSAELNKQRSLTVRLISRPACNSVEMYAGRVGADEFCAQSAFEGVDACQGFSGAPLVVPAENGEFNVLGLVSWGAGCARKDKPGVYVDLTHHLSWIEETTGRPVVGLPRTRPPARSAVRPIQAATPYVELATRAEREAEARAEEAIRAEQEGGARGLTIGPSLSAIRAHAEEAARAARRERVRVEQDALPAAAIPALNVQDRIVAPGSGYILTARGQYRYIVSIGRSDEPPDQGHSCGGVVVSSRWVQIDGARVPKGWVLTAAHCVDQFKSDPSQIKLRLALDSDVLSDPGGPRLLATNVIVHENFHTTPFRNHKNDIALIEFRFPDAPPVNLRLPPLVPKDAEPELLDKVSSGYVVGYGMDSLSPYGRLSVYPHQVKVDLITKEQCASHSNFRSLVGDNEICAGNEAGDSCKGDSGGPLLIWDDDHGYMVVGLVSWGSGCGTSLPGVYVRISAYKDWIEAKLR